MSQSIALLIPCYKAEKFIADLLCEAINQSVPFNEIICYDDCSTDNTVQAIQQFSQVQLIQSNKNKGPAYARNCLAAASKSDFIHFHDADDSLHRDFVKEMLPYVAQWTVTYCAMKTLSYNGLTEYSQEQEAKNYNERIYQAITSTLHLNRCIFPRNLFMKLGGFNQKLRLCEDKMFILKCNLEKVCFIYVDKILVQRIHSFHSIVGSSPWNKKVFSLVQMYEEMIDLIPREFHQKIANQLLDVAWNLYYRNYSKQAYYAVELAINYDRDITFDSHKYALLSKYIGIIPTFRLLKLWSKLTGNYNFPPSLLKDRNLIIPKFVDRQNFD